MFRVLFWKEWRQLALVRWGGIVIGVALPLAFMIGAQLVQRGLLLLGAFSTRDLMFEVLPAALGLGLWPLIGLMATAQVFAADRAAGTENFLLERPVPRTSVWIARLAASFATLGLVIIVTGAIGALATSLTATHPQVGWVRWQQWSAGGSILAALAFLGGTIASSLLTSPMGAILAGGVLSALPVLISVQLAGSYPHAHLSGKPVGFLFGAFLLPAYLGASWAMFCKGEPAGRSRIKRGVGIVVGTLGALLLVFALVAPAAVRAAARDGVHGVLANPFGKSAFVGKQIRDAGGWVVDLGSANKLVFLAPPITDLAWSPDGSRLAIVTWSGALGSQRKDARIDLLSAAKGQVERSIAVPGNIVVTGLAWGRDGLVVTQHDLSTVRGSQLAIDVVDVDNGAWRSTKFVTGSWGTLTVPDAGGRVFLKLAHYEGGGDQTKSTYRGFELCPIDVKGARVESALADASGAPIMFAGWNAGISPSGNLALAASSGSWRGAGRIVDLRTGASVTGEIVPLTARWLDGDRLCWLAKRDRKTRLMVMEPNGSPVAVREWKASHVRLEPSPDAHSVLISVLPADVSEPPSEDLDPSAFESPAESGQVPEEGVLDVASGRWTPLTVFSRVNNDQRFTMWAGPKTLARVAMDVVYFEDVGKPAEHRFVLGAESDLR
jgi:ABC-type transport system involved in multi-copper enzyme maturation permease subunit